jgi:hypothetical protein
MKGKHMRTIYAYLNCGGTWEKEINVGDHATDQEIDKVFRDWIISTICCGWSKEKPKGW